MKRHYYISDDLDDLDEVEHTLEANGITTPQIHVLSENEAGLAAHHLHTVESVLKKDVVRSTELGFLVGLGAASAVLLVTYLSGPTESYIWVPAIFLAVVLLGFCTWEGGLIGIQRPHHDFERFQDDLKAGKHVLFVDIDQESEELLQVVENAHPKMQLAGVGDASPDFVVAAQNKWRKFTGWAP
jgi:hypothetical protein